MPFVATINNPPLSIPKAPIRFKELSGIKNYNFCDILTGFQNFSTIAQSFSKTFKIILIFRKDWDLKKKNIGLFLQVLFLL